MKKTSIETLESRVLFNVTLTNGLAPTDPSFYSVDVGPGGRLTPGSVLLNTTSVMYEYIPYLDTGITNPPTGAIGFTRVLDLGIANNFVTIAQPTLTGSNAVSVGSIRIPDANDFGPIPNLADNQFINFTVTSSIEPGSQQLVNQYAFTTTNGFDLRTTKFYQYLDSDVAPGITDDVLTVNGVTGTGLVLTTIDPGTFINMAQSDNSLTRDALINGWAADRYANLRSAIAAGTVQAPVAGFINTTLLPPGVFNGIGPGYGPNDITTAIEYDFTAATTATVATNLGTFVRIVDTPVMIVEGKDYNPGSATFGRDVAIADEDTTPTLSDGTSFGAVQFPVTHVFTVLNRGTATLSLNTPGLVSITGDDAANFHLIVEPTEFVGAGLTSSFQIQFIPLSQGVKSATVVLTSNDPNTTPYTFTISAGFGTNILPDSFESDDSSAQAAVIGTNGVLQNHTLHANTDVDWETFTLTQSSNVVIETNGSIGDTLLDLYGPDASKVLLTTDDNSGNRDFSRIERVLAPGQYWTRVSENGSSSRIAAYTLSVLASAVGASPFASVGANGVLNVSGTALADEISVILSPGNFKVTRNGDSLFFSASLITGISIDAGDGNDLVTIASGLPAASILGGAGDDALYGGDGADTIDAGAGNDTVFAGAGRDYVLGGDGIDSLNGQLAVDSIYGGAGADYIRGGKGDDLLLGEAGDDSVFGLLGSDVIKGGQGADSLDGGDGDNVITGGAGADKAVGGAGNDLFFMRDGEIDTIFASTGTDSGQVDTGTVADELPGGFVVLA